LLPSNALMLIGSGTAADPAPTDAAQAAAAPGKTHGARWPRPCPGRHLDGADAPGCDTPKKINPKRRLPDPGLPAGNRGALGSALQGNIDKSLGQGFPGRWTRIDFQAVPTSRRFRIKLVKRQTYLVHGL